NQTRPAPSPPTGIATLVAVSRVKVRCTPGRTRSSDEYPSVFPWLSPAISSAVGVPPNGIAAPNATEEEVTRNSRRVGFSEGDMMFVLYTTMGSIKRQASHYTQPLPNLTTIGDGRSV